MQSSCAEIQAQVSDRVLEITINRPERKNALTMAMYSAMAELLNSAASDPGVRVVILAGTSGAFTSGNDLGDFLGGSASGEESPVFQFMSALYNFPKPVVAAVSGPAVGIGTTLLLHCDLAIADDHAVFQMPFVNLGLCPEYGSSFLLPRIMGHAKASELLLLGKKFDAQTAADVNICNEVVFAGEALGRAREYAKELVQKAPEAVRLTKKLLRQGTLENGLAAIREEAGHFQSRLQSDEFREAATAFMEKRPADFSKFD
ncbi:enoyl-CoA hydratase [Microbulbifer hydrolyticus]|uniref:Enoyl-CoA hydratase n=1 Tax=Microbulbifer hydrolyticus TaxID=48074 RepID=A0A6P1T9N8_9GAMM|nr:enoyl-CoA hydratase [Microbulbifer hydrolyticus]MBB5212904.1 enoyl-CoA hydratase/carnithine racemase [Microbulbifer hydrolyticus]QHQ38310.1 enoyl-CoA hydratase [Microbulbifer hydrolyticus]